MGNEQEVLKNRRITLPADLTYVYHMEIQALEESRDEFQTRYENAALCLADIREILYTKGGFTSRILALVTSKLEAYQRADHLRTDNHKCCICNHVADIHLTKERYVCNRCGDAVAKQLEIQEFEKKAE